MTYDIDTDYAIDITDLEGEWLVEDLSETSDPEYADSFAAAMTIAKAMAKLIKKTCGATAEINY